MAKVIEVAPASTDTPPLYRTVTTEEIERLAARILKICRQTPGPTHEPLYMAAMHLVTVAFFNSLSQTDPQRFASLRDWYNNQLVKAPFAYEVRNDGLYAVANGASRAIVPSDESSREDLQRALEGLRTARTKTEEELLDTTVFELDD